MRGMIRAIGVFPSRQGSPKFATTLEMSASFAFDKRSAGVLLHPTSLPGNQGCGVLDRHAVRLLDFLKAAGMKYWQVCPLGPTGFAVDDCRDEPGGNSRPGGDGLPDFFRCAGNFNFDLNRSASG